jgi:hypothetical protein
MLGISMLKDTFVILLPAIFVMDLSQTPLKSLCYRALKCGNVKNAEIAGRLTNHVLMTCRSSSSCAVLWTNLTKPS